MAHDLFTRPGTTTDAVIDIFVGKLAKDEIRRKWAAGEYGTPGPHPEHMKGWLRMAGYTDER